MKISEIKTNASHENVYSLIELNCEIIIDDKLLGRIVPINIGKDNSLCICFPKLTCDAQTGIYKVVSSLPFNTTNLDNDNWGRILQYNTNNGEIVNKLVAISAVWIVSSLSNLKEVKKLRDASDWFIKCVHAINYKSVILKGVDASRLVSSFTYSYFDANTGRYCCSGFGCSIQLRSKDYDVYKIGIRQIKTILKADGKQIALPYELMLSAFQEYKTNNYRNTILNCAMTIEVMFKQLLRSSLTLMSKNDAITDYFIKGADGLNKIEKLMKLVNLPKYDFQDIKKNVFEVRNRIIHGGFFPTQAQASAAIDLTQKALKDYNIACFD